jgi:hypothetical protein
LLKIPLTNKGDALRVMVLATGPTGFAEAWQHSKEFWVQIGAAIAHHPVLLLSLALIPAILRGYFLLRTQPTPRWQLNLTEALLTVWRVLICIVAIWTILTPREWRSFRFCVRDLDQLQYAIQRLGAYLGRNLHLLLWELLIFAVIFWLLNTLLSALARVTSDSRETKRAISHRRAYASVLRNLFLGPLALLYLVAIIRQVLA